MNKNAITEMAKLNECEVCPVNKEMEITKGLQTA